MNCAQDFAGFRGKMAYPGG